MNAGGVLNTCLLYTSCEWSDNPYLVYGGKVLAPEILPLMNDSKLVLTTMTWFKAGAHDRSFNGMRAGAAVVTDDSTYLRREFTDGKELVMFSRNEIREAHPVFERAAVCVVPAVGVGREELRDEVAVSGVHLQIGRAHV